jgi:cytochrome b involved in lipid metabolism
MNTQKTRALIIGIVIALVAMAAAVFVHPKSMMQKPMPAPITATTPTSPAQPEGKYTLADVQAHNSQASCWTTINGGIYDLTSWISNHPGGEAAILSLCGTDGTAAFTAQHGGQGRPEAELASLKIGTLSN